MMIHRVVIIMKRITMIIPIQAITTQVITIQAHHHFVDYDPGSAHLSDQDQIQMLVIHHLL